jgi:hypothetical protein
MQNRTGWFKKILRITEPEKPRFISKLSDIIQIQVCKNHDSQGLDGVTMRKSIFYIYQEPLSYKMFNFQINLSTKCRIKFVNMMVPRISWGHNKKIIFTCVYIGKTLSKFHNKNRWAIKVENYFESFLHSTT